MKYKVEKNGKKAYLQIYEQLKNDIVGGIYPFGKKIPSKRTLSDETGVSVITVEHAYNLLIDEGYIESRERSGYFVIYKKSDFLTYSPPKQASATLLGIFDDSHYIPYTIFAKTMRKVISDRQENLLTKSPNHGLDELRSVISDYLARSQGIIAQKSQIIIGSGAEYLYSLIAQLFSGKIFAIENPSYEKIEKVYLSCNVKIEKLKLENDGINSTQLKNTNAQILHITPFNSFPSGITATVSKRMEYLEWAKNTGGYIIEDNYDSELTVSKKNEDTVFSLDKSGRVIYLNTFSRTIAPSIRVGYMVLPKSLIKLFKEKLGFYSCTVPLFEQFCISELIKSGDFERHINRIRRIRRKALSSNADI